MAERRVLRAAELVSAERSRVQAAISRLPSGVVGALAEVPAGTLITLEVHRSWWDRRPRVVVLRRLLALLDQVVAETCQIDIVAAAILRDGRVLAAQRDHPPAMAGKWEFPGGKVERGESIRAAIVRECCEELGTEIVVGPELGRHTLDAGARLILFEAALADDAEEPVAREHRELRWLSKGQLDGLDWLATNRLFLMEVTDRLKS